MCDFENYEEAVKHYLPWVAKLDGQELVPGSMPKIIKQVKKRPATQQNIQMQNQNINPNRPATAVRKKSPMNIATPPGLALDPPLISKEQLAEKDRLI